ncbi:MAG: hypothetical protein M3179_02250, partial [Actinomycetota bacterium]|nr:hypothetical protein [Actinomycetota bacterium]
MCERIRAFRDTLGAYAEGFDPSLITTAQAEEVVEHAAAIEKIAASLKGAAAARAADGGGWRRNGARSPAHDLARRSGGS